MSEQYIGDPLGGGPPVTINSIKSTADGTIVGAHSSSGGNSHHDDDDSDNIRLSLSGQRLVPTRHSIIGEILLATVAFLAMIFRASLTHAHFIKIYSFNCNSSPTMFSFQVFTLLTMLAIFLNAFFMGVLYMSEHRGSIRTMSLSDRRWNTVVKFTAQLKNALVALCTIGVFAYIGIDNGVLLYTLFVIFMLIQMHMLDLYWNNRDDDNGASMMTALILGSFFIVFCVIISVLIKANPTKQGVGAISMLCLTWLSVCFYCYLGHLQRKPGINQFTYYNVVVVFAAISLLICG